MDFKEALAGLFASHNTTMSGDPSAPTPGMDTSESASFGHGGQGRMPRNPLLDSLAPLLGGQFSPVLRSLTLLHQVFGSRLGLDPTLLLTVVGAAWALNRMWRQLYSALAALITAHFMSSVSIASGDEIYTHMMKWLAVHPLIAGSRSLMAETVTQTAWEEDEELEALQLRSIAGGGDAKYFNFSNQQAKSPPRYVPAVGIHGFWHEGRYYRLHRRQQSVVDIDAGPNSSGGGRVEKEEVLVISCFGRSTAPIKTLLQTVKNHYYADHVARTTIKRPVPPSTLRRFNARNWTTVAVRPVRSLNTVVLDAAQKAAVLADMNEYLHPATPRWYANRGIPLRRGYLFHGPPGTGKTSLSFALAGVFGLDIYVVSLLEPTMTEEDLSTMFSSLPRRCVVLLEDIDAAGLRRPDEETDDAAEEVEEEQEEGGEEAQLTEEVEAGTKKESAKGKSQGQDSKNDSKKNGRPKEDVDANKASDSPKVNGTTTPRKAPRRRGKGDVSSAHKDDWKVSDLARALRGNPGPGGGIGGPDDKKGISLSGLLNAIDGVASQEGRVLVMTTNRPEALDEALIRPGRVDLQVAFANASGVEARELFERMYDADISLASSIPKPSARPDLVHAGNTGHDRSKQPANEEQKREKGKNAFVATAGEAGEEGLPSDELARVAAQFGDKIPDGLLSPAEIQGFLLKRKKHPRRALEETDRWVMAMRAQKESKSKVLSVQ